MPTHETSRPLVQALENRVLLAGGGLLGEYYGDRHFRDLVALRTDATIDFNWRRGRPMAGAPANRFSVRWRGSIEAPTTETYTLTTLSNNGARVSIEGQTVVNSFGKGNHVGFRRGRGRVDLVAGQRYEITVEFVERRRGARATLLWSTPTRGREVVPSEFLHAPEDPVETPTPPGQVGASRNPVPQPAPPPTPEPVAAAQVVGRHVFYNDSAFDGHDPAPSAEDDGAIAPDKRPLLPGGTAEPANYTGYSEGINGIMVDIAGRPAGAEVTVDDFRFRVSAPGDAATWAVAPAPTAVSVRTGAGEGGSDRITVVWPNGAIRSQWLQVAVIPTPRTALSSTDVFYYGNIPGEVGDAAPGATAAVVDDTDRLRTRAALGRSPAAAITSAVDHNRDGRVNGLDLVIVVEAQRSDDSLPLITVPVTSLA